jgi:hypothetical protein
MIETGIHSNVDLLLKKCGNSKWWMVLLRMNRWPAAAEAVVDDGGMSFLGPFE